MFNPATIWHPLPEKLAAEKPRMFTFPFNYVPHPWVMQAADELKYYLDNRQDLDYAFGHDDHSVGKMFGILVVENYNCEIGYLTAFSGKINEKNQLPGFVPPVFDVLDPKGDFKQVEAQLNQLNAKIESLENAADLQELINELQRIEIRFQTEWSALKKTHQAAKKLRDQKRKSAENSLPEFKNDLLHQLENESKRHHFEQKDFKRKWKEKTAEIQIRINLKQSIIESLKEERKQKSADLQQLLHESFSFFNANFEKKSLLPIFDKYDKIPPAGAGECAAPRLLHYAFKNGFKPLALGEFWYGKSPTGQIREHGNFYPACKSKCEPILKYMLEGLEVEPNPAEKIKPRYELEILYEDDGIIAVNKPAGVLSVPGKKIKECLQKRIQEYVGNTEVLLVHRLDMATSGVILAAKTVEIYRILQQQFNGRKVKKTYTAILDDEIKVENGKIDLPIRVDLDHRPMQLVDYEHGKEAVTFFQTVNIENAKTRILFYPQTGRTHQLRVHAAHKDGLRTPIMGDDLYGKTANRLYLHATVLEFEHPVTGKILKISSKVPF